MRGATENNSKIIYLISQRKHVMNPHLNCLKELLLMMVTKYVFLLWRNVANYPYIIPVSPSSGVLSQILNITYS